MANLVKILEGLGYVEVVANEEIKEAEIVENSAEYIGDEDQEVYISIEKLNMEDEVFYVVDMLSGEYVGYFKRV